MKLRKLTLQNVRRFAGQTAVLGPFGDGLTTITAENESGKSTFFGALHALMFYDYGSGRKELKQMQPYSGGAMRISAEVELNGSDFEIEKVFALKKSGSTATIRALDTGTILKQADDAEQWIQDNLLNARKGPFGLLWVRQGTVEVDADAAGIDARRDIMSSVRGQIDAVTGGRRMDSIVQRCKQELDAMSVKNGKSKAGSAWRDAEDRVTALQIEQSKLATLVAELGLDLAKKKKVTARLRELKDPDLRTARSEKIAQTLDHLTQSQEHDRKLQDAGKDIEILRNSADGIQREIARIAGRQAKRLLLAEQIAQKTTDSAKADATKADARESLVRIQSNIDALEEERRRLSSQLTQARTRERTAIKHARLHAIAQLKSQLAEPLQHLTTARQVLADPEVSKAALERLYDLARRRDIAVEKRKVHFSRFILSSEGHPATENGTSLADDEVIFIERDMQVSLPGFGSIALRPPESAGQGLEDPDALSEEISRELHGLGLASIAAATKRHSQQESARRDRTTAQAQIRALAPDGMDALTREFSDLCAELGHSPDNALPAVPSPTHSAPQSENIERAIQRLDEDIQSLRADLPNAQARLEAATHEATEVGVLLNRLRADLADQSPSAEEEQVLAEFKRRFEEKALELRDAEKSMLALKAEAPDLSAATAEHTRAVQADEEDNKEINRLERDLARLDGAIHTQSEGAVEEKLAEISGAIERAKARAMQFEAHVKALRFLVEHLEAARAEAQETYFEPVRAELLPLLRQLHVGADFDLDPDKLLVDAITRNGVTDPVDALSGGAFEQIAILTRLAFARLFAKQGNHVPIILDDALIHTDDERISTMFTLLSQIARDQQIIVLSCRTRAFSDLGGQRAHIVQSRDT